MLARAHRLRLGRDIDRVYRQGRYGRGELLAVKMLKRPSGVTRAVVIVGKKVSKKAVVRNRIRRRLYAIVRLMEKEITAPHDIILNVFDAKVLEEPPKALTKLVKKQLAAAGVLSKAASRPKRD